MNYIVIILSAILSIIVSAVTTFILKNLEYKHKYFQTIITKRIESYQMIEEIITLLSTTIGQNKKWFHFIFSNQENYNNFLLKINDLSQKRMWISPYTYSIIMMINQLFYKISSILENLEDEKDLLSLGKEYYSGISQMRDLLISAAARDYKNLYKIPKLFKEKVNENKFLWKNKKIIKTQQRDNK
jgi:hypothetical protein